MEHIEYSLQIDAPIEAVLLLVGAFDLFGDFHPQVASCDAEGEGVGATRTLWLGDGQELVEELTEELPNGYVYTGSDSVNAKRWTGRIAVAARGEHATVSWTLDFEPAAGQETQAVRARMLGMLEEGLVSAKRQLEGLD
ncbi:MAG: SRPBCC family protein [Sandaracinaceae bacterium]|nr:SRPBCC family protein [Sandaracinaceae bacterium]